MNYIPSKALPFYFIKIMEIKYCLESVKQVLILVIFDSWAGLHLKNLNYKGQN